MRSTYFITFGLTVEVFLFSDDEVGFLLAGTDAIGLVSVDPFGVDFLGLLLSRVKKVESQTTVSSWLYLEFGKELILFSVELHFLNRVQGHHVAR